jgi:hypothetical protein
MAAEFCVSLAKCLKGRSEILVRDQKTLSTIEKVLIARERLDEAERSTEDDENNFDDDDEEEDDDDTSDNESPPSNGVEITLDEDVNSLRERLKSGWDGNDIKIERTEKGQLDAILFDSEGEISSQGSSKSNPSQKTKRHRLASLFGNAQISSRSPDMPQDVVRAVRNNAMPMKDEENIIILNANGQDETVAVRALVDKYQKERKIILVNCQFSQVPRELQKAEIVYSILPLVVKEKDTGRNLSVQGFKDGSSKVVVLRRYPKDWEIFVDIGNGFQLVETTLSRPTIKAVTDCLQRFLKSII